MTSGDEVEKALRELPLRGPSAELDARVLAAATPRRRWLGGLAMAASVGLACFVLGYAARHVADADSPAPPAIVDTTPALQPPEPDEPARFNPQRFDMVMQRIVPEDSFVIDSGPPIRAFRRHEIDRTVWIDPQRNITVELNQPSQQVIYIRETPH